MQALNVKLKKDFGIEFKDETLLLTAFTHTSYANEQRDSKVPDNERLEFLGDAALELVISRYLYTTYPKKPEGELSKLRSNIVREESLADYSRACGFDGYVRLGKGEERMGGRQRNKILEDLFEAFLGALLLDQGIAAVEKFLYQVIIPDVSKGQFNQVRDHKTQLQELLQVNGDVAIRYSVIDETGPAHAKLFTVSLTVDGQEISRGKGRSKKLAEQDAAKQGVAIVERGDYVLKGN